MEVLYHEKNVDTDKVSFWEIFCKTKHAKERQKKTWNKKRPWNDPFFHFPRPHRYLYCYSSSRISKLANLVYCPNHLSFTVQVEPLRCFPIIISVTPFSVEVSLL